MADRSPADLRVRRERLGLSQTDLARLIDVDDRTVRRWERGATDIGAIRADVWTTIGELEERADALAQQTIPPVAAFIERMRAEQGEPDGLTLWAFRTDADLWDAHPELKPLPAAWHRAVLARIREHFAGELDIAFSYERPPGLPE